MLDQRDFGSRRFGEHPFHAIAAVVGVRDEKNGVVALGHESVLVCDAWTPFMGGFRLSSTPVQEERISSGERCRWHRSVWDVGGRARVPSWRVALTAHASHRIRLRTKLTEQDKRFRPGEGGIMGRNPTTLWPCFSLVAPRRAQSWRIDPGCPQPTDDRRSGRQSPRASAARSFAMPACTASARVG